MCQYVEILKKYATLGRTFMAILSPDSLLSNKHLKQETDSLTITWCCLLPLYKTHKKKYIYLSTKRTSFQRSSGLLPDGGRGDSDTPQRRCRAGGGPGNIGQKNTQAGRGQPGTGNTLGRTSALFTFPSTSVTEQSGDSTLLSRMRHRALLAWRLGTRKLRGNGEREANHGRVRLAQFSASTQNVCNCHEQNANTGY